MHNRDCYLYKFICVRFKNYWLSRRESSSCFCLLWFPIDFSGSRECVSCSFCSAQVILKGFYGVIEKLKWRFLKAVKIPDLKYSKILKRKKETIVNLNCFMKSDLLIHLSIYFSFALVSPSEHPFKRIWWVNCTWFISIECWENVILVKAVVLLDQADNSTG